jgi:diguanylate cyclase (GGDEF)-like protein
VSRRFDDIRYSELLFLSSFPEGILTRGFNFANAAEAEAVRMSQLLYVDMAMTLLEELYIRLENDADQLLVSHLRGELTPRVRHGFRDDEWDNPRSTLQRFLVTGRSHHVLRITYRGLRRIEELREVLRRERVLEDFGVLLSIRYLNADLEHAVQRPDKAAVSVMCADMDGFKAVNDRFGHAAGDVLMKAYLESVRDVVGAFGEAYRGSGDEVVAIIIGQGHERAVQIGENVRTRVAALQCEYRGQPLPTVSASIGVATTPPEERSRDVYLIADRRQGLAKQSGKNQVVAI